MRQLSIIWKRGGIEKPIDFPGLRDGNGAISANSHPDNRVGVDATTVEMKARIVT
jgi:hypothetical protein